MTVAITTGSRRGITLVRQDVTINAASTEVIEASILDDTVTAEINSAPIRAALLSMLVLLLVQQGG